MKTHATSFWASTRGFAALVLIGSVTYFLLIEHRQHFYEYVPYLILLACVFMHLFMHHGHSGHHGESASDAYTRGLQDGRKENDHAR